MVYFDANINTTKLLLYFIVNNNNYHIRSTLANVSDDAQYVLRDCKNRRIRRQINKNKIEIKNQSSKEHQKYITFQP